MTRAKPADLNYRKTFQSAADLWALAHQWLPAAQAGDADAQYHLYAIDRECHGVQTASFVREGRLVSLDDALRWDEALTGSRARAEHIQQEYGRCSGFYTHAASDLGDPLDWLQRATDAGQPIAQSTTALLRLGQEQQALQARAAGTPPSSEPPIGGDADPRELLRMALASKDPEVLFAIGSAQVVLNPTQSRTDSRLNQWAWMAAACQRGLDCSEYGPPVSLPCAPAGSDCGTVPQMLLSWAGNNWAPIEERVQQINAVLDEGQTEPLSQLGLGSAGN